ncbi:MAG TPA: hypothetical protein VGS19_00620 [Streptosporangiaceae bacterium]|nr:hypothetical protein [Streptosporangiaceae bacterium]
MTLDPDFIDHARKVADAVLYEGYLLYPYRGSAQKNQARFQFGVLMPPCYKAVDPTEPSACQTECLLECPAEATVHVVTRFLQLQRRRVQACCEGTGDWQEVDSLPAGDTTLIPWDEAVERERCVSVPLATLLDGPQAVWFHIGGNTSLEDVTVAGVKAGRLVRTTQVVGGVIGLSAKRVAGPYQAVRLRVTVENHTAPDPQPEDRTQALPYAMIATHSLIAVPGGSFLSMTDPPEWAAAEVARCVSTATWPVLAGPQECRSLMLSSPVILYDHAEVAAESPGEMFDATEIDEILTLRTLALTDEEKREARATDPRAAMLMDRLDTMPGEWLERMHGAIRSLRPVPAAPAQPAQQDPPWWDPGADTSVSPGTDHVMVGGVRVARGSLVRMRPGARRADAQDLFLAGREALVEAVLHDVDGQVHVAVSPAGDPLAELQASHGRFLYFAPDEIEPVQDHGPGGERAGR